MKRIGNLYQAICSLDNLRLADRRARKGKLKQTGVRKFDLDHEGNLQQLHHDLVEKTYRTPAYRHFIVKEPKVRKISELPYRDRVVHHAIMIHLEEPLVASFTADTYSCIKGRGIHGASSAIKHYLRDQEHTAYCLKLDITQFYPSIDHDILKTAVRRKIKDSDLLWLLDDIIDSSPGLPIGNYLSQFFSTLYLNGFDHYLKEVLKVKRYARYADDIVIFSDSKPYLQQLLQEIRAYLSDHLKLNIKRNYQVFPVAARGVDMVGYVHRHTHTRMRKSIKQNFARAMARDASRETIASYRGWAKHCDSKHLIKKLIPKHDTIQRLPDRSSGEQFHRRQDQNRAGTERKNRSARI